MSLTDAPAIVSSLSVQLAACASWVGGSGNHWYPIAPENTTVPFAILDDQNARRQQFAAESFGLLSGTLVLTIVDSAANRTLGQLETFGRTILKELLAQSSGIAFRDGDVGLVRDYIPATEAVHGTASMRAITLTIPYGLGI